MLSCCEVPHRELPLLARGSAGVLVCGPQWCRASREPGVRADFVFNDAPIGATIDSACDDEASDINAIAKTHASTWQRAEKRKHVPRTPSALESAENIRDQDGYVTFLLPSLTRLP